MVITSIPAGRAPLVDFNRWVDSQIDYYKNKIEKKVLVINESSWIAHPVQKEAIQNSADAEMRYSSDDWYVVFEIDDKIPPRYISITDQGTVGLTGRAIVSREELDKLQKEKPNYYQKERWAKFEALSYPNIDPIGRGSRGQGKWMFIGASEKKTIFYDTLRHDRIYRLGAWLGEDRLLEKPPEGYEAKMILEKNFPYLKPLDKIGTRVIIVSPKQQLWNGFLPLHDSDIKRYIEETWWELLRDNKKILIKWRGQTENASCPKYYTDKYIHKKCINDWWISNTFLNWEKNSEVKVVELMIIYSKEKIPREFRGIAIQRGGMKICNYDIRSGNPQISNEIAQHIYGWIILNDEAEKELRLIEDPTHYDFSAYYGSFGYFLFGKNGWLSKEIKKFGEQKLGLGSEEKKFDRLDIIVANKLNKFLRKYYRGVPLNRPVSPPSSKNHKRELKDIRIKMYKPTFPSEETRKVNFGESVSNIQFSIINNTKSQKLFQTSLVLKTASKTIKERVLINFISNKVILVNAQSESKLFGPFSVLFNIERFDSGTYVIEAEIVLLEGEILDDKYGKGVIVDRQRELIYLNVDPPTGRGILEFIDRVEFKEEKELQYRIKEKEGKIRIEINIGHPAYKNNENLDYFLDKRNLYDHYKGNRPLLNYELSIGAEVLSHFDIREDAMLIKDNKDRFITLRTEDKNAFFIEAIDQASRIAQRIRNELL